MMTTIDEIYELQKRQIMAAFYGEGPWELDPSVRAKYFLSKDEWDNKNSDEKEKYFLDFCSYLHRTRPATITDREKLIELSARVNSIKGKDNQRKRPRNERAQPKYHGNPKKQRSEFMKDFDAECMKDILAQKNPQKESTEASIVVDHNVISDDTTETSAPSNNKVDSKKGADSRKKYKKNNEGKYACEYCDSSYTQPHNLKKHLANKHKTKVTAV